MKYNTKNENLCLWRCHPEKICINCKYFSITPEDKCNYIIMSCDHPDNFWGFDIDGSDTKEEFINKLLTARECDEYNLKPEVEKEI